MTRLRIGLILAGILVLVAIVGAVQGRGGGATPSPSTAPTLAAATPPRVTPPATPAGSATPAAAGASPTPLVIPTPAIPLPACPPQTVPGVDNSARYGFCAPLVAGWGAYNDNNSAPITQIVKARPGPQAFLPTDVDRVQIAINLNVPPAAEPPPDCRGAANDSIAGFPTHHCAVTLDPARAIYHGVRAEYWMIDLPQNRRFFITAIVGADATPDDQAVISPIVHAVKPPAGP